MWRTKLERKSQAGKKIFFNPPSLGGGDKEDVMKKYLVFVLMFIVLGCMAQPVPEGQTTSSNTFVLAQNVDMDGDGYADGGIPAGSTTNVISEVCSQAPSDGTEEQCTEQLTAALKGTGDCKKADYPEDVALCVEAELDCSVIKYSICAYCVNPGANEVLDGIDNDCNGAMLDNECGDDEDCTEGVCDTDTHLCTGCLVDADCDDANACTTDVCTDNACVMTDVLDCCLADDECNDGNICTTDTCLDNACVATGVEGCCLEDVDCDDTNACTADSCDLETNTCLSEDLSCNDDDACTLDSCDPATGCIHSDASACDDQDACTTDSCDPATGCLNEAVDCDDSNACTTDSCDPAIGCANEPIVGCAAVCDPANDEPTEDEGDCAPFRDPALGADYGWGCFVDTCVAYEDADNDEWADTPEQLCSDGIDGDLDGDVDCDDADCALDEACAPACVPLCDGLECGSDGCGGFCGDCVGDEVCNAGVCEAPADPVQPEGQNDCADGLDNDDDGLIDCEESACAGAVCDDGMTCQAGECKVAPPLAPETFVTVTVESPANPAEIWLLASGANYNQLAPATFDLTQVQACSWGVEITARTPSGNWPYWGCPLNADTPSKSTLIVKVDGVVAVPTFAKHAWVCDGQGEGNLFLSKTQLGCP